MSLAQFAFDPNPSPLYCIKYSLQTPSMLLFLYCHNKTNEIHQFLKFIFGIELYMFRTGFLSIIRSLVLYAQQ